MPNFVYDALTLPYPKTDLVPVPGGADPTKYVNGSDWNRAMQALLDLRTAVIGGDYFGFVPQAAAPGGAVDHVYLDTMGRVVFRSSAGVDFVVPTARVGTTRTSDAGGQVKDVLAATLTADGQAAHVESRIATLIEGFLIAASYTAIVAVRRDAGVLKISDVNLISAPPNTAPDITYVISGTSINLRITGTPGVSVNWRVETLVTLLET